MSVWRMVLIGGAVVGVFFRMFVYPLEPAVNGFEVVGRLAVVYGGGMALTWLMVRGEHPNGKVPVSELLAGAALMAFAGVIFAAVGDALYEAIS